MALLPKVEDAAWRENCEVFLVAIVVALAVRTFFLQPFTIPTGSMQPTLNGILGYPTTEEPPNVLVRLWDTAIRGRTWIKWWRRTTNRSPAWTEVSRLFFFTYTRSRYEQGQHLLDSCAHADADREHFGLNSMRDLPSRRADRRGYIDTGDHVFVDKISYQFRPPQRGDVFVFNTEQLPTIDRRHTAATNQTIPTQFDCPRRRDWPTSSGSRST